MLKKSKKLISCVCAIALVVSMFSTTFAINAFGSTVENHPVKSLIITDKSGTDVDVIKTVNQSSTIVESGNFDNGGSFAYDVNTNTLTIKDAVDIGAIVAVTDPTDDATVFKLKFVGNNKINNASLGGVNPIHIEAKSEIILDSTSNVVINNNNNMAAIYTSKDLTINGNNGSLQILDGDHHTIEPAVNTSVTMNDLKLKVAPRVGGDAAVMHLDNGTVIANNCQFDLKSFYSSFAVKKAALNNCTGTLETTCENLSQHPEPFQVNELSITNSDLTMNAKSGIIWCTGDALIQESTINGKSELTDCLTVLGDLRILASKLTLTPAAGKLPLHIDGRLINVDKNLVETEIDKNTITPDLVYKSSADYSDVNMAIATAEELTKTDYVDFKAVDDAIAAVDTTKDFTEQADVDAMAATIYAAIDGLKMKSADYTKVDEAVAKANALDKTKYVDFSAVDKAVKAVDRNKSFKEQADVDVMAADINAAIDALVVKTVTDEAQKSPETGAAMSGLMLSALAFGVATMLNKKRK